MSVALTRVTGADYVVGNKRAKVRDLAFTSTYPDGGESVTAANVGLKKIEQAIFHGIVISTDRETANIPAYDYTNSKVVLYESGAANAALAEKTDDEAHATGAAVRATFIGY